MADLFAGPNVPITKAFLFCGWKSIPVDWELDRSHDLSDPGRQHSLQAQLSQVDCIVAAFDCSTKSRAREIPRVFADGRPAPKPLRTESYPEGLPNLSPSQAQRVETDNLACAFVLEEIDKHQQRGGISIRENPFNSLHWHLPKEIAMMKSGSWQDTEYSACCFGGARCKHQRLRHNLQEITEWPPLQCQHSHDPQEWEPWEEKGARVYPSKMEAEYTAPLAFAIAVAASWWALRTGRAKLHVPRMPTISCVGRREHWLSLDPRSMREWAMTPLAITLGLEPLHPDERRRVPRRARVEEVLTAEGTLPPDCIYVGLGHHSHRLPTTCWKSPWVPGHSCSYDEWLVFYVDYIRSGPLWNQLPTLAGHRLVCDCAWQSLCEADVLAGLCFDVGTPLVDNAWRGTINHGQSKGRRRLVQLVTAAGTVATSDAYQPIPQSICPRTQEATILLFKKLFPGSWFEGFQFPMIEDLLNISPFGCFEAWLQDRSYPVDGPLGPLIFPPAARRYQKSSEAQQVGAFNQRAALPPLLPFGLDPDQHFAASCELGRLPLPTEQPAVLDLDLQFAAHINARHRGKLRTMRERAMGVLKELHRRWQPVTSHLRALQSEGIRKVTAARDLGFTALLLILCSWPDTTYPHGLIRGLPAVGFAPCYSIFPELHPGRISFEEVMGDWLQHNFQVESQTSPGRDDDFTLQQSCLDADKGFCTYPLTRAELHKLIGGAPFRLIPRCVITQSSGKQRVIDDAYRGGQSETSRDCSKLVLCSPLRPAQHAQALLSQMTPPSSGRVTPLSRVGRIGQMLIDTLPCPTLKPHIAWWYGGTHTGTVWHTNSTMAFCLDCPWL